MMPRRNLIGMMPRRNLIVSTDILFQSSTKARWFCRLFFYTCIFLSLYYILYKNNIVLLEVTSNAVPQYTSPLAFVTIEPYFACNGDIEKIVCTETIILVEADVIPLQHLNDSETETAVCNMLRNPGEIKSIIEIPVCIQTAYTVGIMTLYSNGPDKAASLQFVANGQNEHLQEFIRTKLPATAQITHMKRVDFPMYYNKMSNYYNQVREKHRDNNYGNMIWRYASSRLLNPITTKIDPFDSWPMINISNDPVDALVVASANTLHITKTELWKKDIEEMTARVQYRNIPTIVLGIGVQVEFENMDDEFDLMSTNISFPFEYQKNVLSEISKRQTRPAIGVRGDLTKTICLNSGIGNCISMGCPTLTISRDVNLGRTLNDNWFQLIDKLRGLEKLKIAIPLPSDTGHLETIRTAYGIVARMIEQYGDAATLIAQQPNSKEVMTNFLDGEDWKEMNPSSKINSSEVKYDDYQNVESWLFYAGEYDLCISFRIHGSMPCIASGVPTIVVPIDFRILELISAMKIPYLLPVEIQDLLYVHLNDADANNNDLFLSLMGKAHNQDFKEFEINRRNKIMGWKSIIESAGLEIDPSLIKIINTPI